jgi:YggT family protein
MRPALIFIIQTIVELYLYVLLLRFWLPFLRADFRNPIAQGILRLTSPVVVPVRRIVPPIGRIDTATVVVSFAIQCLLLYVILIISGLTPAFAPIALTTIIKLAMLTLNLFKFAILIFVILSWVAPGTYNPVTAFISMIVQPVLRPFRELIPPIGMLDLSALVALIALHALGIFLATLVPPLV